MYSLEILYSFFKKCGNLLQTRFGSVHKRGEECFSGKKNTKSFFMMYKPKFSPFFLVLHNKAQPVFMM